MKKITESRKKFVKYMDDDLNAPQALAAVFEMVNAVNQALEKKKADKKSLQEAEKFMIDLNSIFDFISEEETIGEEDKKLIQKREEMRAKKEFAEADKIREILKERGIIVEDTPEGVRWKKLRK